MSKEQVSPSKVENREVSVDKKSVEEESYKSAKPYGTVGNTSPKQEELKPEMHYTNRSSSVEKKSSEYHTPYANRQERLD